MHSHSPFAVFRTASLLVATALAIGCGGSPSDFEEDESAFGNGFEEGSGAPPTHDDQIASATSVQVPRSASSGDTRSGDLPTVYVHPSQEKRWSYVYQVHGETYREAEFLGLCRTIARDNPAMPVKIVPDSTLSRDEIDLVRARIRENGLTDIHILTETGTERIE